MRRSTAAAVGTLTGAALIAGVRLSVSAPVVTAAPPAVDVANSGSSSAQNKKPAQNKEAAKRNGANGGGSAAADASRLKDGVYKGKATDYAYGTIQVSIKVDGGKITSADATYPATGLSASINPKAITQLKEETLEKQSAKVNTVSGATLTSASYKTSLQAALDAASA
ncbi:MAG TPA: FMN-binding protein [Actinoplanes sp.]|jgi:uncharacterized protein with FMN-binding domain|nr:FMN-binding protein [Actinoplanes sp.]